MYKFAPEKVKRNKISLEDSISINLVQNLTHCANKFCPDKNKLYKLFVAEQSLKLCDDFLYHSRFLGMIFLYKKNDSQEWYCGYKKRFRTTVFLVENANTLIRIQTPFSPHWTKVYEDRLNNAWNVFLKTENEEGLFAELFNLAIEYGKVLFSKYQRPLSIVCGPISGGSGNRKENILTLKKSIFLLSNNPGKQSLIFDQIPFEVVFEKYNIWVAKSPNRENKIMSHFYDKIFESGLLNKGYFLRGWDTSRGASHEREKLTMLKHKIVDLDDDHYHKLKYFWWKHFFSLNRRDFFPH